MRMPSLMPLIVWIDGRQHVTANPSVINTLAADYSIWTHEMNLTQYSDSSGDKNDRVQTECNIFIHDSNQITSTWHQTSQYTIMQYACFESFTVNIQTANAVDNMISRPQNKGSSSVVSVVIRSYTL